MGSIAVGFRLFKQHARCKPRSLLCHEQSRRAPTLCPPAVVTTWAMQSLDQEAEPLELPDSAVIDVADLQDEYDEYRMSEFE